MIRDKRELDFYLKADLMMNRGYFSKSLIRKTYEFFFPDVIMKYLSLMRKYSYYKNREGIFYKIVGLWYRRQFFKYGYKLGFSIGEDVFGYGLVIHHNGTIVVGNDNTIGNYACIHTSTLIIQNGSVIGDGLFLGSGAKITRKVSLGNNVWVGANSVVNTSFADNCLVVGIPGRKEKDVQGGWYQYLYSETWLKRFSEVEKLKMDIFNNDK